MFLNRAAPSNAPATARSSGSVTLRFAAPEPAPAAPFRSSPLDQPRLVGGAPRSSPAAPAPRCLRRRAAPSVRKSLRRLRGPEPLPAHGLADRIHRVLPRRPVSPCRSSGAAAMTPSTLRSGLKAGERGDRPAPPRAAAAPRRESRPAPRSGPRSSRQRDRLRPCWRRRRSTWASSPVTASTSASRPGGAATTTSTTVAAALSASSDHASIGRPPSSTSALGPPAPSLCPEPAAASTAVTPLPPLRLRRSLRRSAR